MTMIALGKPVPGFTLPATGGKSIGLADLRGRPLVLYFYPKDDTPGCTSEGCGFRDHHQAFRKLGAVILGVSRDPMSSHEKFKAKYEFPFDLLSDADEDLCRLFGVMREKNMYGKKVMGVERSTFLIDGKGVLRQEWRKVKVEGHVEAVLAAVKAL
ncbi:Putative peroxiredoxin bcp [Gammaproteobacteria bacterium]|nr:peroxiredoxin [Gammaproteobacteria bacterium]CAG0941974.1 Putative peroxiredoxin bcp [Gammaproteobacteria bacterium]